MPEKSKTMRIALMAMFSAITCVLTLSIQVPVPATQGYFNLGEASIYIAAILFGPVIGSVAGGLGASIADIISGYTIYAPATLIIKGVEGFAVGTLFITTKRRIKQSIAIPLSSLLGGITIIIGYFLYEYYLFGPAAIAEIPVNIAQVVIGTIISTIIISALTPKLPRSQ